MATRFAPGVCFQHPRLGTYTSPDGVVSDERLSDTEKQMVIEAWRSVIDHRGFNQAETADIRAAIRSLNTASGRLAGGVI